MTSPRSLTAQEFDNEYGSLHHSIFSQEGADGRPFVPMDWKSFLVPYGYNMEEQDFRGLALAAKSCGDQEIVIVDAEANQPSEAAIVIEASWSAFETAKFRPNTNLTVMDTHLFGRSGSWGCICAASCDDVAIVGAEPDFIARFLEAVGGIALLRDRFLEFATLEWSIGKEARSHLLEIVGW